MTTRATSGLPDRSAKRRAVFVIVGVLGSVGVLSGLIWPHLVPDVEMVMTNIGPFPVTEQEAGQLMAMDGWYALLGGVGGLLTGATLGATYIRHGAVTVLALLVGSTIAAVASLIVGSLSGGGEVLLAWEPDVPVRTELSAPLMLHAYGVLLVWPIATLAPVLPLAWLGWEEGNRMQHEAVTTGESEGHL